MCSVQLYLAKAQFYNIPLTKDDCSLQHALANTGVYSLAIKALLLFRGDLYCIFRGHSVYILFVWDLSACSAINIERLAFHWERGHYKDATFVYRI